MVVGSRSPVPGIDRSSTGVNRFLEGARSIIGNTEKNKITNFYNAALTR